VTQTDNPPHHVRSTSLVVRLAWILLILATLYITYFHDLGAIGLVGPDEPRYTWIARDMVESGDWITPRLYGKPWFEKPVLYYWGAALCFKLFGVSDAAARLPSAISALLATLAMAWLARRVYGTDTARWLLLLLPTTVGMIGFSHAAATDMPFAGMLTIAMVFAAVVLGLVKNQDTPILPRTPWLALSLFGFFFGLAVLAKGPAATVLSGGAVLLWAATTKRWRDATRCLHPVAIASFCLTALPWYILCACRNPDFFRVFIIEHNFKRYLTSEFQHIQPFWFYIPVLMLALFPWTLYLIPAAKKFIHQYAKGASESSLELLLLFWSAFPVVFFSISKSKLPGYILPTMPPLVLLLACLLTARLDRSDNPKRWPAVFLGASLFAAGLVFFFVSRKASTFTDVYPAPASAYALSFLAGLAGALVVLIGLFRYTKIALFAGIISMLLAVVHLDHLLTRLDAGLTARSAAAEARRIWPEFSASEAATWRLKRSLVYQLNFYTHANLTEWEPSHAKPEWLFIDPQNRQEARNLGFACSDDFVLPAVIPCKNYDSGRRLSSLGGFDGRGDNGDRTNRQAR
jgi:4-amino-4-deoxy-L-arabinose transferase-like glycosyltransferase